MTAKNSSGGFRTMKIDVMRYHYNKECFVKTLTYRYWPHTTINIDDFYLFVITSLPSLENQKIKCYFDDEAVKSVVFIPRPEKETTRLTL